MTGGLMGGYPLGHFIDIAEHQARQREIDNQPCPTCGGDRLRSDFTGSGRCHAPRAREENRDA